MVDLVDGSKASLIITLGRQTTKYVVELVLIILPPHLIFSALRQLIFLQGHLVKLILLLLQHVNSVENGLGLECLFQFFPFQNLFESFHLRHTNRFHFNLALHHMFFALIGIWVILNLYRRVFFVKLTRLGNLRTINSSRVLNTADQCMLGFLVFGKSAVSSGVLALLVGQI